MATIAQSMPQSLAGEPSSQARPRKSVKSWAPTAKVSAGVLAGAGTILLSAFLSPHWKNWTEQDMTPAIGAAITNILTFVIQYFVPDANRK